MEELAVQFSRCLLGLGLLAVGGMLLFRRLVAITSSPPQRFWLREAAYPLAFGMWAGALWLQGFPLPLVLVCAGALLVALGVELRVRRQPATSWNSTPAASEKKKHWTRHPATLGAAALLNVLALAGPVTELVRFQSRPISVQETSPVGEATPAALAVSSTTQPCGCNQSKEER